MTDLWLRFAAEHKALAAMAPAILLISGFLLLRWSYDKILGMPVPPLIAEADMRYAGAVATIDDIVATYGTEDLFLFSMSGWSEEMVCYTATGAALSRAGLLPLTQAEKEYINSCCI